jgi:hypothetical protein
MLCPIAAPTTEVSMFLETVFSVTPGCPLWMWLTATNPSWQTAAHQESYATAKFTILKSSKKTSERDIVLRQTHRHIALSEHDMTFDE